MFKKFVPLNHNETSTRNPYEVRTYMGEAVRPMEWHPEACTYDRDCNIPPNSTLAQVLTLEDEIKRLHYRTRQTAYLKKPNQKCEYDDEYMRCVMAQRTPKQLKRHAIAREGYIKVKNRMDQYLYDMADLYANHPSLIQIDSPIGSEEQEEDGNDNMYEGEEEEGEVKPELASPECSMEVLYIPTKRILDLKRQKSGILINESEQPDFPPYDEIPYSTYNPRQLQEEFNNQGLRQIDVLGPNWTWNIGLQKDQEALNKAIADAADTEYDCKNAEVVLFNSMNDYFSAGIVFGSKAVIADPPSKKPLYYNRPKEMACLFVAFVEGFRLNADFWTAETMDNIINMGEKLVEKSAKMYYKSQDNEYDILPEITERDAVINIDVYFTGPVKSHINMCRMLTDYFCKYNACILLSNDLYLLIWKRCKNFFYIYDPNGREENCERDFETGKSGLMSTNFIENLVHLIINISKVDVNDEYTLYAITLKNFGKIVNPVDAKDFPKRTRKMWSVINETYALIPSCNYGLTQPNTVQEPNPSMMISVMALLYSHIEKPKTWDTNTIDQIIRLGTAYYKSLRRSLKLNEKQHLNIMDLLEKYVLGYYSATLKKKSFFYTGTVTDYCKRAIDSLLAQGLKQLFTSEWEAALVQIDNSVIAVWRDNELFYVYDAFKRGRSGQVLEPDDYKTDGTANLQLHTTFDSMIQVVYHNALRMRRGGKFFIHGINVGCIRPIMDGKQRKLRYTGLKLTPEKFQREDGGEDSNENHNASGDGNGKGTKNKKKGKEKPKKEHRSKYPAKVCSIHTIPEEDRIVHFDITDITDSVLDDFLCDVVSNLPERSIGVSRIHKCANRVLLKSDKEYLQSLKYMVKHGEDYDNYDAAFQTHPDREGDTLTLQQELALSSNYQTLPDGTWIIFGSEVLPRVNEEEGKLRGFLSAIVAAAMSTKYKISTWNSRLVDYSSQGIDYFGEDFQLYQYALGAFLSKKMPHIKIGKTVFEVYPQKIIKSTMQKSLRQVILECLINSNRIIVVCQRFSCLIIKRYNFLYLYIGFPMNEVGYRKNRNAGPASVMRFVELDALMRRIEYGCNPLGCEITQYVLITIKVRDITPSPMGRYRYWPNIMEERIYTAELANYRTAEDRKSAKLRFLDDELTKEEKRIRDFVEARNKSVKEVKAATATPATGQEGYYAEEEYVEFVVGDEIEEGDEEGEEECDIKPQHEFGKQLAKVREDQPQAVAYGYRLREKDLHYKIQGSKAIEGRLECMLDNIKPCFFASTLAILYAIMRPLNQWNTYRVDQVINSAIVMADRVEDMSTAYERLIKHITVDDYVFNIVVSVYDPLGMGSTLLTQLTRATRARKYILLHTANCTYAIFRDQYYHLFDPYASMETTGNENDEDEDNEEGEGGNKLKPKLPKGTKKYGERNTASWVLFADLKSMLKYMNQRSCNVRWKEDLEYTFHVVNIMSYRKAKQNAQVLNLLTGMAPCDTSGNIEEYSICAHNESIAWLDHCLPVWSRLNRRNAAGRYRGQAVSKLKKYDIEINGLLWSLWGNLHPAAAVFEQRSRNKQYLACCVMALCAARMYRLIDWSSQLLDSIIINGDRYHQQSLDKIKCVDYEFYVEDLNVECWLDHVHFNVHIENVIYGKLYAQPSYSRMNLAEGLMYFFNYNTFGILQCFRKCLAIGHLPGHDGGYFMFDCQSRDHPLYPHGQGSSYILRTKHLQVLLYCIIVTLNVPYYNIMFTIHKVDIATDDAVVEEGEEEQD